ncbi:MULTISPECIES: peptidoglycan-associated lipoprotein Pal [unclassified Polaromonas]|uniref:peptidoglycan-associated lipoprotein Pal n=1 Tax=unclassified Polaromonas TaxID=2638319 RepID=UPI0018C99087|nr:MULTISPECIES: peptidoglycan-associated lipoprotein Pal [unclassified Polaromonas]MBG6072002.1 peptidoglycan-associated lipoprotein [Polaromonas sp. CG_9.7]MBG6114004.1 peptidoglycan-associated lipoprotein [Polaromonas sp. CG_9.2]MDH6184911.1 peptidoglycan-associated lipoprotein [Polaromonas sp. CG_23.6]
MKRFFSFVISYLVLATALVACGSNVKLQDVPVEDRSTTSQADADAAAAAAAAARGVTPVQIGASDASVAGPANTARIVYFDFDSFVVKPEFQSVIEAHAKYLSANKSRRMAIEGHTDESGGREYNLALGQKRAESVRRALGLLGVTDSQVEAVSFGKEKPAVAGFDQDSMARNRRAELNYR